MLCQLSKEEPTDEVVMYQAHILLNCMVLDVNSNFVYFQHKLFIRTPQWEFSSLITTIIKKKKRLIKKIVLFYMYWNHHKQVWTATETYRKRGKEILEADHSLSCI